MAINVTSSTSAQLQQAVPQSPTQRATKPTVDADKEQQAQQAQQQKQADQPPKPVVNTQGQTTGKVINITA